MQAQDNAVRILANLMFFGGFGALVAGLWLYSRPLALVVGGVLLMTVASLAYLSAGQPSGRRR